MIQPSDVALLAAMWRALEQHAGDEEEAADAAWQRIKSEPALREAFLKHVEQLADETSEFRQLVEEALRGASGDPAAAQRAFLERIDARENPATAERLGGLIRGVFTEIMQMATKAWRREREGGTA